MAVYCFYADTFHQFCISYSNRNAVYFCNNTVTADLFYIGYTILIDFFAIGCFQAAADRMCGKTFCKCCIFQDLCFFHMVMMNTTYFKYTFCKSSCLVKYNIFYFGKCFQIVGTFYQDTCIAGTTDSCKEAQRNTDDQGTRAADYKESKGSVDPLSPHCRIMKDKQICQWRKDGQCQRSIADCRCIIAGKFGNKVFGSGLAGAGILYQFQDLGYGRFTEFLRCFYFQYTCHVDASTDDLISRTCIPRKALTCKGTGIQSCTSFQYHAINGNLFSRLYNDH